jgi:hypothetical protein
MYHRTLKRLGATTVVVASMWACTQKTPVVYEKDRLSFTYFSNWQITGDKLVADGDARLITIEGPRDAVMTLTRFAGDNPTSLEDYAKVLDEERAEGAKKAFGGYLPLKTGQTNTERTSMMIAGQKQSGLMQTFVVRLLGTEVPHRAIVVMIEGGGDKWFLMAQASTEDWKSVESGFQKVLDTLAFAPSVETQSK